MCQWYTFTTAPGSDPLSPVNFSNPQPNKPTCPGNSSICAICADDNGFGFPNITSQLVDEIIFALQTGTDQSRVALRV